MTIMKRISLIQAIALLAFPGCGTETGNPGDGPKSNSTLQARIALDVNAHIEELSDSTDDPTDSSEETALGLLMLKGPKGARSQTCTESNGQATVVADIESSKAKPFRNRKGNSTTLDVTRSVTRTLVLSRRDGVAIQCAAGKQTARLRAADFANLESKTALEAYSRRAFSGKDPIGETVTDESLELTRSGSRSVSYSVETESTGLIRAVRKVSSDFTQTQVRTVGTQTTEYSSRLIVDASNPLVIAVERPSLLQAWTTRMIKSGLIKSIAPDGSRVETTIENLILKASSPCQPESGSISGSFFAKADSQVADSTYTVTFTAGAAQLTIQGVKDPSGKTIDSSEDLSVSFCDAE